MARADLLKKIFSSYKTDDKESFLKAANEIIEDERKKNHGILADELRAIISNGSLFPKKGMSSYIPVKQKGKEYDVALFEIIYPDKMLSDVILSSENEQQIEQIIREYSNWDVLISNGVTPMRRVLFYGPPGCGKTLTAKAIASEIGLPLVYVRFDAVVSSYLGETAGNIRRVFDFVNGDSYVMLFDEFDAIARSRNDQYEHGEIKRVVNTFLQQIDNFNGRSLVIAATNFEKSLDYAIWRRFDCTLKFDMPTNNEQIRLFNLRLKQFKGAENIIIEFTEHLKNFSHADVEMAAYTVIKQCILDGRRIYTKKDVEKAIIQQEQLVALRKTQYQEEG